MRNLLFGPAEKRGATSWMRDFGLLSLRLGAGGFMAYSHGWTKLRNYGEFSSGFPDPLGMGSGLSMALTVGAEFFCALALLLGLMTRLAAVPLAFTMAVAGLLVHADDPFAKKEMALLYLAAYIALMLIGAGRISLDKALRR